MGLRQFAAALLAQDRMDHPGPPGAAWTQYRAWPEVCDRLAAVIAERAGRNFPFQLIMAKTRHKSPRTAMRYVKPGDAAVAEVTSLLGPPRRSH
jgi:hypothetical protein